MKHSNLTSREIITRVIEHKDSPRIGFSFNKPHIDDIIWLPLSHFKHPRPEFANWGTYPELLAKVPGFRGEVFLDSLGNIIGRLEHKTKGECIHGVLEDGWENFEQYEFPAFDESYIKKVRAANYGDSDKFVAAVSPLSVFSTLRDMRLINNALMDTILEPDHVRAFLNKVTKILLKNIEFAFEIGANAYYTYDDWGMQDAPLISPSSFEELFKPVYKKLANACHERGMKFFIHSCGHVWDLIPHLIYAGVDVFQFDQPELSGSENFAKTFGKQATLYSPVDIQKIMPTGDRQLIESTARNMIHNFQKYADGSLIAKDYPTWEDINIPNEWADWARNVFLEEGWNI